jgi:hypothetical protein
MNEIRARWNALPQTQRVALALIPVAILVALAVQQRIGI